MSASQKVSLIGLSVLLVTLGLGWGVISVKRWAEVPEIRKGDVILSTVPQSRGEASAGCPIPLPATATNVQYAVWTFGEVVQAWIRFEAPPVDCLAHAKSMVQPFKNSNGYSATVTPIHDDTGVLCVLDPSEVDLSWFEGCETASGLVFRVEGGRAPVIWVDTEKGVFYCEVKNACHSLTPP